MIIYNLFDKKLLWSLPGYTQQVKMERRATNCVFHFMLAAMSIFCCDTFIDGWQVPGCKYTHLKNFEISFDCHNVDVNIYEVCHACKQQYHSNISVINLNNISSYSTLTMPPFCFRGCNRLRTLKLRNNNIECLTNYSLADLDELEELDLAQNNLSMLTNKTFHDVPQLRHLDLAFCNLSFVDAGTFMMLHNLIYLNLSNNEGLGFVSLRNVSFSLQFTRTEVLDYSKVHKQFGLSTELRRCDVWYLYDTTIKKLYIDNNRMVERNALHLVPISLEIISVQHNQFIYGPYTVQAGCLQNVKRIEINEQYYFPDVDYYNAEIYTKDHPRTRIDIHACQVPPSNSTYCPFLDEGPFYLSSFRWPPNLKEINFRGSNLPISFLPKSMLPTTLEAMDMSNNIITTWRTPSPGISVPSLRRINLSNNFASVIEDGFFDTFPNLGTLDVSNNLLGEILSKDEMGLIFKALDRLKKLDLSSNKISYIPDKLLSNLKNLSTLHLSYNGISKIDHSFAQLSSLITLDLQQNKISTLPTELLQQMDKLSDHATINLKNNTLEISCENVEFLEWISDHPRIFEGIESYTYRSNGITCVLTYDELKQRFISLTKSCKNYTAVIIISTILIVGFIVCILGGLGYRYRWRLRYLYYMAKARYRGYDMIDNQQVDYRYDAFISYAAEDYLFIKDEIIVELEENSGLSLCIHQRDFLPGNYIAENILKAIKTSRKVVIVLTSNFLKSKWCMYEFNMARMETIYSRNGENVVFCIMLDDIDTAHLSPDLIETLESETFLKYPDIDTERPYFWSMLKRTLVDN